MSKIKQLLIEVLDKLTIKREIINSSQQVVINIAKDFYPRPVGRYLKDSKYSGEAFREQLLIPALQTLTDSGTVIVDFEGTSIAGSSFIEEVFGGLYRSNLFTQEFLTSKVTVKSERRSIIETKCYEYMKGVGKNETV